MAICPKCSLPEELCACSTGEGIAVTVKEVTRRYGKKVTVVSGIPNDRIDEIAKELKRRCAAGGTTKDSNIEIQGSHTKKVKDILKGYGFDV